MLVALDLALGEWRSEVIAGRSRATWSGGSETAAPAVAQPLSATAGAGRHPRFSNAISRTWSATCPTTLTVEIDEMKYSVIILQHSFSVQEAKAFL
jgi:hypothetical protein